MQNNSKVKVSSLIHNFHIIIRAQKTQDIKQHYVKSFQVGKFVLMVKNANLLMVPKNYFYMQDKIRVKILRMQMIQIIKLIIVY